MINRRSIWAAFGLLLVASILSGCSAQALPMQHWPGLTVADGIVYAIAGTPQQVMMYDAMTGESKGSFMPTDREFPGTHYWSPVAAGEDGLVFVGFSDERTRESYLYAFDTAMREKRWSVPVDEKVLASPIYSDGVVYLGTSAGSVYAIDTATASVKPGWPFKAEDAIWGSPLLAEGRLYVPSMDHNLYSLDAASGQLQWTFTAGGALAAKPQLAEGRLYVGAFDAKLYALDPETGEQLPGFDFKAANWIWSEAQVVGDRIYVTDLDGKLHALDAATGQPSAGFQTYSVAVATDYVRAAPAVAGDMIIVVTGEGRVRALKADTGQEMWPWPDGTPVSGILTNPVVAGDRVYFILMNGQVHSLLAATGQKVPDLPGWPQPPEVTQQ